MIIIYTVLNPAVIDIRKYWLQRTADTHIHMNSK